MLRRVVFCDMRLAASCGMPVVQGVYLAVASMLFLCAGQGAWVFVPVSSASFFGFFPDVSYAVAETGCSAEQAIASACLAHAVLLPVTCLVSTALFAHAVLEGGALRVSVARGRGIVLWLAPKVAVSWLFSVVPFVLATVVTFLAHSGTGSLALAPSIAMRVALACVIALGCCALCWAIFVAFGTGPASAGMLFVAGIAAFVAQMSLPSAFVPTGYAMLSRIAGIGLWQQSALPLCASCVVSLGVAAAISAIGFARRMR
ncbi:MAG: hypothetical protein Q4B69_08060 [Slackia sp.]|nr:hypothetical protein [Slackia sp.]